VKWKRYFWILWIIFRLINFPINTQDKAEDIENDTLVVTDRVVSKTINTKSNNANLIQSIESKGITDQQDEPLEITIWNKIDNENVMSTNNDIIFILIMINMCWNVVSYNKNLNIKNNTFYTLKIIFFS
jgi:hypothetical protein